MSASNTTAPEDDWGYLEANIAYNTLYAHTTKAHADCEHCRDIRMAHDPQPPDFPEREKARERLRHGYRNPDEHPLFGRPMADKLKGLGAVIPEASDE